MNEPRKYFTCDECYKQASEEVKNYADPEEMGPEVYYFLHYEFNHGNKELLFPDTFPPTKVAN